MPYDEVVSLLHSAPYNWPTNCTPAPQAVAAALETRSPEEIAAQLEQFCRDVAAGLPDPYGYPGGAYALVRYRNFSTGREFWELNTQIALGLAHETPVPHWPKATAAADWWSYQEQNRSYLGFPRLPLDDPDGAKERAGRWKACEEQEIPLDWKLNGLSIVYQFLTREGLNNEWRGFGYFGAERSAWDDYRNFLGFTPQMVLDNLHAAHRLTDPRVKWLPGGARVEGWED